MNSISSLTQLHLGLGSFHRAHQAVYLQDLHEAGDTQWQIVAGNIRPDMQATIDALKAQNCEYTLETVSSTGERAYQLISAIKSIVDWDEQLVGLTEIATQPSTQIISFTVTEAGYYLDEHGQLDDSYADLKNDLDGLAPCTVYGAIATLLRARMQQNTGPVTLLNCDNLRSNGSRFKKALLQFIERIKDDALLAWVNNNTSSPNSMVDRITPRPTDDIAERVLTATGRKDQACVMGETFIQWVIEDDFIAARPAWENAGVQMVDDVMPYEEAKIRLLNATHSCIAWGGTLLGYQYIHEGSQDPRVRQLAYNYVTDDVIACLDTAEHPSPIDLAEYRDIVLGRFSNPNVLDTNQRVAMDAYSKIPGFILPTISDCIEANRSIASVAALPALFLAFLVRYQRGEIPFKYEDQGMDEANAVAICTADDVVLAFANDRLLFRQVAGKEQLVDALRVAYQQVEDFIETGNVTATGDLKVAMS